MEFMDLVFIILTRILLGLISSGSAETDIR